MTPSNLIHARYRRLLGGMLIIALAACGAAPDRQVYRTPSQNTQSLEDQVSYWLAQADKGIEPKASSARLKASRLLLRAQQKMRARALLDAVAPEGLSASDRWDYQVQVANFAAVDGDAEKILRLLDATTLAGLYEQPGSQQQAEAGLLRAQALAELGQTKASVEERVFVAPLLQNQQLKEQNQNAIWAAIKSLPSEELESSARQAQSDEIRGWLTLGFLNKLYANDFYKLKEQIGIWRKEWLSHPGNNPLPDDLQALYEISETSPNNIVLMLPFGGRYGAVSRAIRDGFLAAHFDGGGAPAIHFVNTSDYSTTADAYAAAMAFTPDMIVGPLQRRAIADLRSLVDVRGPKVLALNYIESEQTLPFFQFGLSAADEAEQIASYLIEPSLYDLSAPRQRALVIRPAGTWGERVAGAFQQTWLDADFVLLDEVVYQKNDNLSALLKQALLVDQSEVRRDRIARLLGETLEFTPRRRKDIDMIFLAAQPAMARSLKPMLAFHYAGDVPVYATSHIYSGKVQSHRDRDLNEIFFTEIPWLLDRDNVLRETLRRNDYQLSMERMYALGVDAYQLCSRLDYLAQAVGTEHQGVTGRLSVRPDRRIKRELDIAQIRDGEPRRVPPRVEMLDRAELPQASKAYAER